MFRGRFKIKLNVTYQLRDKNGKIKPIFQENGLFRWLMKHNILSPLAPKIPFILGNWSDQKIVSNLVTTTGKAGVAARINGCGSPAAYNYIANGTGTTAAVVGDTALEAETSASGLARATGTASLTTTDTTDDTANLTKTFTSAATVAITECGVLNAAVAGILLSRQVFAAVNVVSGDSWTPLFRYDCD